MGKEPYGVAEPATYAEQREGTARVVGRIDRDELCAHMANAFRVAISGYKRMDPAEFDARIVPVVRRSVDVIFDWALHGQDTPDDLAFAYDSARISAVAGIAEGDVLAAYHMAAQIGIDRINDSAHDDERAAVVALGAFIIRYMTAICAVISDAYASARNEYLTQRDKEAAHHLEALLAGQGLDAPRTGFVTVEEMTPFVVLLSTPCEGSYRELAERLRRRTILAVVRTDHVAGVTTAAADLERIELESGAILALDRPRPVSALASGYQDALTLARRAEEHQQLGTIRTADYEATLVLSRSPQLSEWLHTRVTKPLAGDEHEVLRLTLRVLVAHDFDRAETSKALHVHRNTLIYRLKRIEELTGLDISRAQGAGLMSLAVTSGALD